LAAREADPRRAPLLEKTASVLLGKHVLAWLPAYVAALDEPEDEPQARFREAAQSALAIACQAAEELGVTPEVTLPDSPLNLDDEATGLADIADWLVTPCYSGLFLGHTHITRVARAAGTPRGFGGRRLMMSNLLRSAAGHDSLTQVVDGLRALVSSAMRTHARLGEFHPVLRPVVMAWLTRLKTTDAVLERIGNAS
jgi:hypothetical protein